METKTYKRRTLWQLIKDFKSNQRKTFENCWSLCQAQGRNSKSTCALAANKREKKERKTGSHICRLPTTRYWAGRSE